MTTTILLTLLSLYRPPAREARCLDARRDEIIEHATSSAERYDVPVAILLVTAFLETHIGCDRREGGNWGAPASRRTRHVAGTSDNAASALAFGFRRCGSWLGAVHHYRVGLCNGHEHVGYTAEYALHIVARVHAAAGIELPERFLRRDANQR